MKSRNCRTSAIRAFGLIGSDHGVGTTHFAIALANFMVNVRGKTTVIVECNNSEAFQYAKKYISNKAIKVVDNMQMLSCNLSDFQKYDCIIFDMHYMNRKGLEWLKYCSDIFVMCSLSVWKVNRLIDKFLSGQTWKEIQAGIYQKNPVFLSLSKNEKSKRVIKKHYGIEVQKSPYIENPFELQCENLQWFDKIIGWR